MTPLLFWKIIGYGILLFFGIGILAQILGAVAPILIAIFFAAFSLLAVATYPLVFLIRLAGYKKCPSLFPLWHRLFNTNYQEAYERPEQQKSQRKQSCRANEEQPEAKPKEPVFDPWEILEVPRNASKQEIKTAYRNKIVLNHPDKVASLDPELQNFATKRTVLLRKAYEQLVEAA